MCQAEACVFFFLVAPGGNSYRSDFSQKLCGSAAVDPPAVDHHGLDVLGRGRIHDGPERIVLALERIPRLPQIEEDKIGLFPRFDAPDLGLEAEDAGASDRGKLEERSGRQGRRPVQRLLKRGRQAHLMKHVEAVVAGSAVGAEADADPAVEKARDVGDTRPKLEIGGRAMRHARAACGEQIDFPVREVDAVGQA